MPDAPPAGMLPMLPSPVASRALALALVATAAAAACAGTPRDVSTTTTTSGRPRVEVARADGTTPEHVREVFGRAIEPVKKCVPGSGRLLTFRARTHDGNVRIDLESAPLLSPSEKACVMEALSSVVIADTAAQAGAPQIPPSGFTSLVTVTW